MLHRSVFAFFMSLVLSIIMSAWVTYLNLGLTSDFIAKMARSLDSGMAGRCCVCLCVWAWRGPADQPYCEYGDESKSIKKASQAINLRGFFIMVTVYSALIVLCCSRNLASCFSASSSLLRSFSITASGALLTNFSLDSLP